MKHKTAERWLAADLGGSLSAARRAKLEAHLASCAKCRETRKEWGAVQSRAAVSIPPEKDVFWADNLNRLRTALDQSAPVQAEDRKATRPVPGFFPWKTWAWGAGGAGLAAAAALLFVLLQADRPLSDVYALSFGDHRAFLEEGLASDETVLADFNESVRSGLTDSLELLPADIAFLTADHTLSLESLSDEDVLAFMNEIALEMGAGEK